MSLGQSPPFRSRRSYTYDDLLGVSQLQNVFKNVCRTNVYNEDV